MRLTLSFLLPFLPLLLIPRSAAQAELECPNADLTAYLLQLIDALYANGLTTFESLLAEITSTDDGYNLLSTIFASNSTTTILVPTDSAFQMAGVWAPFEHQSSEYLVDLFGLHSLQGHYGFNESPSTGMVVADSMMRVLKPGGGVNTTMTSGKDGWVQKVVMNRGEKGQVVVKTALGDITSWSGPAHLDTYNLLDNIVLLPIDHVITAPPNISTALTLPSTTRSPTGLPLLLSAITKVSTSGADALTEITSGGLTFFAPVNDAWTAESWAQMDDKALRAKLIGTHYSTNATIFSSDWLTAGAKVTVMTGEQLELSIEGDTSFVSLGAQKAQILRSDIVLENGVLHIIDKVFLVTGAETPAPETPGTPPAIVNPNDSTIHAIPPSNNVPGSSVPPPPTTPKASGAHQSNLARMSALYWTVMLGLVVWYHAG